MKKSFSRRAKYETGGLTPQLSPARAIKFFLVVWTFDKVVVSQFFNIQTVNMFYCQSFTVLAKKTIRPKKQKKQNKNDRQIRINIKYVQNVQNFTKFIITCTKKCINMYKIYQPNFSDNQIDLRKIFMCSKYLAWVFS